MSSLRPKLHNINLENDKRLLSSIFLEKNIIVYKLIYVCGLQKTITLNEQ